MSADSYRSPDLARATEARANELAKQLATGRAFGPANKTCPACAAPMTAAICSGGHITHSKEFVSTCPRPRCPARATETFVAVYCSPMRRFRWGFLWLKVCKMGGSHLHQECRACGWRGFAAPLFAE